MWSTHMDLQDLFFDSTEELSRQGHFQWIYLLRAAGTPEISVQPCLVPSINYDLITCCVMAPVSVNSQVK